MCANSRSDGSVSPATGAGSGETENSYHVGTDRIHARGCRRRCDRSGATDAAAHFDELVAAFDAQRKNVRGGQNSASRRIRSAACASRDMVDTLPPAVGETLGHAGRLDRHDACELLRRQRVARTGEGRIDFGQRDEHERALVHALVRKPDRTLEPQLVEGQHVQVDRPRSPAILANAAQTPLDRLQGVEQFGAVEGPSLMLPPR